MKDSMHNIPDNLLDRQGHAKWQKGLFIFSFLLHEKTSFIWLTLKWIICILKQNLKA